MAVHEGIKARGENRAIIIYDQLILISLLKLLRLASRVIMCELHDIWFPLNPATSAQLYDAHMLTQARACEDCFRARHASLVQPLNTNFKAPGRQRATRHSAIPLIPRSYGTIPTENIPARGIARSINMSSQRVQVDRNQWV